MKIETPPHSIALASEFLIFLILISSTASASTIQNSLFMEPFDNSSTMFANYSFPVANFSTTATEGYAPLTVQFNDSSKNATGRNWDFGDEINSTQQNLTHTYYAAGNYTVNLTATNKNGTNSKFATITVFEKSVLPIVNGVQVACITNFANNTVSIIDTATDNVSARVHVGDGPLGVAVSQNGRKIYVANQWSNTVSVINATTNATATIPVGSSPRGNSSQ